MHALALLILCIGIFQSHLSFAQDTPEEFSGTPGMVYVEPTEVVTTPVEGVYKLVPYSERRKKWGYTVSFGYSSYEPINYEPDFITMDVTEVYSTPDTPMLEFRFTTKRNTEFGSLGGEFMIGIYSNASDLDPTILESELQIMPIYLGAILAFDALTKDPRFVPYVSGGLYTILYEETADARALKGNTQVAPYVTGGMQFQLDWIDTHAARIAFEDSGIQASYLYAQAAMHMESSGARDKDFSSEMSWGAGIRVEF